MPVKPGCWKLHSDPFRHPCGVFQKSHTCATGACGGGFIGSSLFSCLKSQFAPFLQPNLELKYAQMDPFCSKAGSGVGLGAATSWLESRSESRLPVAVFDSARVEESGSLSVWDSFRSEVVDSSEEAAVTVGRPSCRKSQARPFLQPSPEVKKVQVRVFFRTLSCRKVHEFPLAHPFSVLKKEHTLPVLVEGVLRLGCIKAGPPGKTPICMGGPYML